MQVGHGVTLHVSLHEAPPVHRLPTITSFSNYNAKKKKLLLNDSTGILMMLEQYMLGYGVGVCVCMSEYMKT